MKLLEGLEEVDELMSARWRLLTGDEVKALYDEFWYGVKELNGNAEGFTGLAEFVLLRFLVNMLGGAQPRSINKELSAFQCNLDGRCWITHTHAVDVGGERGLKPDVGIWLKIPSYTYWEDGGELRAAIEIKAGLDQGIPQVNAIQANFQRIISQHPKARCLLIVHRKPSTPVQSALAGSGLDFLVLQDDQNLLWRELSDKLGMSSPPFRYLIRAY